MQENGTGGASLDAVPHDQVFPRRRCDLDRDCGLHRLVGAVRTVLVADACHEPTRGAESERRAELFRIGFRDAGHAVGEHVKVQPHRSVFLQPHRRSVGVLGCPLRPIVGAECRWIGVLGNRKAHGAGFFAGGLKLDRARGRVLEDEREVERFAQHHGGTSRADLCRDRARGRFDAPGGRCYYGHAQDRNLGAHVDLPLAATATIAPGRLASRVITEGRYRRGWRGPAPPSFGYARIVPADSSLISVTAKVAAYYRQFSDIPFAAEVARRIGADEAFEQILREHGLERDKLTFYAPMFEARYKSITQLILESGASQVLELASGYSLRGLDLSRSGAVRYVETDLPDVVTAKLSLLDDVRQQHGLRRAHDMW